MKSIFLLLGLFLSLSALSETVSIGQFEVETESGLIVKRTELSFIIEDVASGDLIKLSPFRMAENVTFQDVVKEEERSEYLSIGEFRLSPTNQRFNFHKGPWERSWLAYSRDFVFLIKNESRKENYPELESFVHKVLLATTWAKR